VALTINGQTVSQIASNSTTDPIQDIDLLIGCPTKATCSAILSDFVYTPLSH
jgi:hypothetical protein